MKKKIFYILFCVLALTMVVGKAYADDDSNSCSLSERSELRQMASEVTINYVPVEFNNVVETDEGEGSSHALDIYIYNLNTKINAVLDDSETGLSYTFDYTRMNSDGAVVLRQTAGSGVKKLKFYIYPTNDNCNTYLLRTVNITLPKFNNYSLRGVCSDIPEYYLCQRYITYDINDSTFTENVNKYKEKLAEKADEKDEESNTSVVGKTVNNIAKYKYVIAVIVILAGAVITYIVIKKKRSAL